MRSDVLKVVSSARNVTNAIVLTHNIDFVFVQTVALSAFRRCGHPTITVFADSGCAADSFAQQRAVLTDLGVRYRVVPVAMGTGFRFHPKAVLLTGEQEGSCSWGAAISPSAGGVRMARSGRDSTAKATAQVHSTRSDATSRQCSRAWSCRTRWRAKSRRHSIRTASRGCRRKRRTMGHSLGGRARGSPAGADARGQRRRAGGGAVRLLALLRQRRSRSAGARDRCRSAPCNRTLSSGTNHASRTGVGANRRYGDASEHRLQAPGFRRT